MIFKTIVLTISFFKIVGRTLNVKFFSVAMKILQWCLKDTHRKEAFSNKIPALTKSTYMGIWDVGTSNQLL